jgi:hypothetical protein
MEAQQRRTVQKLDSDGLAVARLQQRRPARHLPKDFLLHFYSVKKAAKRDIEFSMRFH